MEHTSGGAFVVRRSFQCSRCRKAVHVKEMGERVTCHYCKTLLEVPVSPLCPSCGKAVSRMTSPEEQARTSKGKLAGTLMYGPAGLLAGAVLDGVKKEIKKPFYETRFLCMSCHRTWAIELPPAPPEAQNFYQPAWEREYINQIPLDTRHRIINKKMDCPHCDQKLPHIICLECGGEIPENSRYCCWCRNPIKVKHQEIDVSQRILCSDGSCIGIINEEGICNICKKPYSGGSA